VTAALTRLLLNLVSRWFRPRPVPSPCYCDYGQEPCPAAAVPGGLLCAVCAYFCMPLAQGKNPFDQGASGA
jgi:hypothetical protein